MKSSQADYHCNELSAHWYCVISRNMFCSAQAISNNRKIIHIISVQDEQTDQRSERSTSLEECWVLLQALTRAQTKDVKVSEDDTYYCRQCSHCWAHQHSQDNDQQAKAANDSSHESEHVHSSFIIQSCSSSDRVISDLQSLNTSYKRDSH